MRWPLGHLTSTSNSKSKKHQQQTKNHKHEETKKPKDGPFQIALKIEMFKGGVWENSSRVGPWSLQPPQTPQHWKNRGFGKAWRAHVSWTNLTATFWTFRGPKEPKPIFQWSFLVTSLGFWQESPNPLQPLCFSIYIYIYVCQTVSENESNSKTTFLHKIQNTFWGIKDVSKTKSTKWQLNSPKNCLKPLSK